MLQQEITVEVSASALVDTTGAVDIVDKVDPLVLTKCHAATGLVDLGDPSAPPTEPRLVDDVRNRFFRKRPDIYTVYVGQIQRSCASATFFHRRQKSARPNDVVVRAGALKLY